MTYVPTTYINELKEVLSSMISNAKAYDVPNICKNIGLQDGDESEAFSSKNRYVRRRLDAIKRDEIVAAARVYLEEYDYDYFLLEAVLKIEEIRTKKITEITRKRIMDLFGENVLCSEMGVTDFLKRVWPIHRMRPHYTGEFENDSLEVDIYQHCVRNDDWSSKELLEALGFMTCSERTVFKFLHHVMHPMVQSEERQKRYVSNLNNILRHDGFELGVIEEISGCPVYRVFPLEQGSPADQGIADTLKEFNPDTIHARWTKALDRRSTDTENAIALSRTLIEDVCKWILHEADKTWEENDDISDLYKKTSKLLNLAPDDHTEKIFKQILGGCNSVVLGLGSLRNKLSDAHSPGPKRAKAQPRHAELAVNLSGAMATFLVATWKARQYEAQASTSLQTSKKVGS